MTPYYNNQFKYQTGVSMIEVLVLVIIMSIGLLGIAGLQVAGLKQTAQSGTQTQAMFLAEDIIARIRSNRVAVLNDTTVIPGDYTKKSGSVFPTAADADCAKSTGCTMDKMAKTDLFNWSQIIQNSLPTSATTLKDDTYICLDSNPDDTNDCDEKGSTFVVQIGWNQTSTTDASATVQTYRTYFEP